MSAIEILKSSISIIDNEVLFKKEINRSDYLNTKKILENLGGKYQKNQKKFVFDESPKFLIQDYINTGIEPKKNPTAYFPTPQSLIEDMARVASFDYAEMVCEEVQAKMNFLEPSGGQGGIADYVKSHAPHINIDIVEILPTNQNHLKAKGYDPYCMDFMEFNLDLKFKYDYIFMNPPFQGNTYIKHLNHAYKMLKDNGTLSAIIPTSFLRNKDKLSIELLELVSRYGEFYPNPKNSFIEQGTNVDTCIVMLQKEIQWKERVHYNYKNWYVWYAMVTLQNEFEFYDEVQGLHLVKGFKYDYKEVLKKLILKHIDLVKEQSIFVSKFYIDDYVDEMVNILECMYENEEIDFTFDKPFENKKSMTIYGKKELEVFASGSLF